MTNANTILSFIQSNMNRLTNQEKVITLQTVRQRTGEQLTTLGINPTYPNLASLASFGQLLDQNLRTTPVQNLIETLITAAPALPNYPDAGFVMNQISVVMGIALSVSRTLQMSATQTMKDLPTLAQKTMDELNSLRPIPIPVQPIVNASYPPFNVAPPANTNWVNQLNWTLLTLIDVARILELPVDQAMTSLSSQAGNIMQELISLRPK